MRRPIRGDDPHPTWPFALPVAVAGVLVAADALGTPPHWVAVAARAVGGEPRRAHGTLLALVLLVLARGLLLRRSAAYRALLALAGLDVVATATRGGPLWRLPVLAGVVVAVYLNRARFPAVPHPARVRAALRTGIGVAVLVVGYGTAGLVALRPDVTPRLTVGGIGRELLVGVTATPGPLQFTDTATARWFLDSLAVLGGGGLIGVLALLLAPAPAPAPATPDERAQVRRLVHHPGSDTLAPFALRRDKAYVFSPDRRAAVGYRVLLGTAVVGGDPVGDPGSYAAAVEEFLDLCARSGWRPAALAVRGDRVPLWRAHGLHAIGIGDEVLVTVGDFSLATRRMRNVRQAVQRTVNAGVTTRIVREGDLRPHERAELRRVAAAALNGAAERGFSMNLDAMLTGEHDDCVVVVAYDATDTRPVGFQRYAPCGGRALSLDAMRRVPGAPNGVNERMIVDLLTYAREHGVSEVSLNFAAFRAVIDAGDDRTPRERVGYRLLHLFDPFIAVEALYRFNRKFRPRFVPRSVVFRSWAELGWVGAALLGLEFALPYDRGRVPEPPAADRVPGREDDVYAA